MKQQTINIFTLSYSRAQYYFSNNTKIDNARYYFIDNNKQKYTPTFACNLFTTERNIGCAGGWNLICKIAFDYLKLDKIVITQDDATIPNDVLEQLYEECGDLEILGAIQPFFEFSTFVITRQVWNTVGAFDENFIYVYCEDADYKHRCMLSGISINSMYLANIDMNKSASIADDPSVNMLSDNRHYLAQKWGISVHPSPVARADTQPPFKYTHPFNEPAAGIKFIPKSSRLLQIYGDITEFPSELEYKRFLSNGFISV